MKTFTATTIAARLIRNASLAFNKNARHATMQQIEKQLDVVAEFPMLQEVLVEAGGFQTWSFLYRGTINGKAVEIWVGCSRLLVSIDGVPSTITALRAL